MSRRELPGLAARTGLERRLAELLELGFDALEALGRGAGRDAAEASKLLEDAGQFATQLMDINQRLTPLMRAFQPPTGGNRWWRWYTGVQLEYEVQLADVCKKVAYLVETGQQSHRGLRAHLETLTTQFKLMRTEIELLEADIEALRLLGSREYLTERLTAGYGEQEKARLMDCLVLLERLAEATHKTQDEYQVAIQRFQPAADRYREIRTLLLPMWKRAVGFDLFVRGGETTMIREEA